METLPHNQTFASPAATAKYAQISGNTHLDGMLGQLSQLSAWQVVLTIFALLVAYDQGRWTLSGTPVAPLTAA